MAIRRPVACTMYRTTIRELTCSAACEGPGKSDEKRNFPSFVCKRTGRKDEYRDLRAIGHSPRIAQTQALHYRCGLLPSCRRCFGGLAVLVHEVPRRVRGLRFRRPAWFKR